MCWQNLVRIFRWLIIFSLYTFTQGLDGDILWASISNNSLMSVASLLKQCSFKVKGKVSCCTSRCWIKSMFIQIFVNLENNLDLFRANLRTNLSLLEVFHCLRWSLSLSCLFEGLFTINFTCNSSSCILKISLKTMESRLKSHLFLAGEVMLLGIHVDHHLISSWNDSLLWYSLHQSLGPLMWWSWNYL